MTFGDVVLVVFFFLHFHLSGLLAKARNARQVPNILMRLALFYRSQFFFHVARFLCRASAFVQGHSTALATLATLAALTIDAFGLEPKRHRAR
jgi:hypothetical protein